MKLSFDMPFAKRMLFVLLVLGGIVWVVSFLLEPAGVQSLVFSHAFAPWFGDFSINRIVWDSPCPYEGFGMTPAYEVVYPLLAHWLLTFFPDSVLGGMIHSVVCSAFLLFALSVFIWQRMQTHGFCFRLLALVACLCPWQMIYVFERSNQVILAAGMVVLFLAWFDSDRIHERCLAAIALSIAVALKVSPVLFGLCYFIPMWGKERRRVDWLSISLCGGSAAILAFGPLWWHGQGFVEIARLYRNVSENADKYMSVTSWGPVAVWRELSFVGGAPSWFSFHFARMASVALGLLGLVAAVLPRRFGVNDCERLLFLSSAVMLLPTNSCAYMALYLLPAFLLTRNDDWGMCALWLCLFLPIQIPADFVVNVRGLPLNPVFASFAFLTMLGLAYVRILVRIIDGMRGRLVSSTNILQCR